MKTLILLIGLSLLRPLLAEVTNADLQHIRELATQGKHEEALQKHLWFHEKPNVLLKNQVYNVYSESVGYFQLYTLQVQR